MDFNNHKATLFNFIVIKISLYGISFYVFGSLNEVSLARNYVTENHIKLILLLY